MKYFSICAADPGGSYLTNDFSWPGYGLGNLIDSQIVGSVNDNCFHLSVLLVNFALS
jgi:hypothetical protein